MSDPSVDVRWCCLLSKTEDLELENSGNLFEKW